MGEKDILEYWKNSAENDYETMLILYKNKKFSWSLFIGHLVIEKLLKALYAKNNIENPYCAKTHNLLLLAEKCKLELTEDQIEKLQVFNRFNISGRYDDYKKTFEKKCTRRIYKKSN